MSPTLKYAEARATLRAKYNMTLHRKDGEYRVNFFGGREATAYYTNDLDDAIATAERMAETR